MKNRIVRSESVLQKNPITAFLLSFFFTGLGQIYNGDLSKCIVFFGLKTLTLLIIPLYVIHKSADSNISFFVFTSILHLAIIFISPLEAMYKARKERSFNFKGYNSLLFYFIYAVLHTGIILISFFIVSFYFNINKIKANLMNPTLHEGEYVLINKYEENNYGVGNVIKYTYKGQQRIGRILAKEGEQVYYKGNIFYIKGKTPKLNIMSESQLKVIGLDNREDLFIESISGIQYPVQITLSKSASNSRRGRSIIIENNMFFITFDNRRKNIKYELIEKKIIEGKVEGIIYSSKIKRILLKPYVMN
ncbi:MAG: signal peptidase I [Spirochaetota bacterium]|nr:signal peptidase I [Spirochaetota bacterium]